MENLHGNMHVLCFHVSILHKSTKTCYCLHLVPTVTPPPPLHHSDKGSIAGFLKPILVVLTDKFF